MNKTTEQFYIEWKANLDDYLSGYAFSLNKKPKKLRFIFLKLEEYFNKFINNKLPDDEKIVILPGIRGVGKTTLLSQLYFLDNKKKKSAIDYKIYISADRLLAEGISLKEFFEFLDKQILDNSHKKILILIDEIQYDPNWSLFLKLLFDKTKGKQNILVFATGSSAVFLNQQNQDLVRRAITQRVLPEKFNEYLFLHQNINIPEALSAKLKKAIFYSEDTQEILNTLTKLKPQVIKQLSKIKNIEALKKDYFSRGSFPFSAQIETQPLALERIKNMILINIIQKDLVLSGNFDAQTLIKIPDLLFLLANSDEISVGKLSQNLQLHLNTVNKILDTLVKAEILFELKPYGQPHTQVRKASKFLFISPNIRASLLNGFINLPMQGKFFEDYIALIFEKEFKNQGILLYDYAKNSADFIFRLLDTKEIIIEVGLGKEEVRQVENTLKKTKDRVKYSLVIGSKKLEIEKNIIKIPLNYFLLI